MFDQNFQKVYAACGILHAAVIQQCLEKAGIPTWVRVSKNTPCLEILVPASLAEAAAHLLNPQLNLTQALS